MHILGIKSCSKDVRVIAVYGLEMAASPHNADGSAPVAGAQALLGVGLIALFTVSWGRKMIR